jgi:hypothetical protein
VPARLLSRWVAAACAVGVVLTVGPASGKSQSAGASRPQVAASSAAELTVHVTLSKHRVRIGHRLLVDYSWHDGNGDLVDTNDIGTMAIHVQRNVSCKRTGGAAHPISGHGTWVYRPQPEFTGAFTNPVRIRVGFNVRTGGCARIEEETATEIVTVLPAATG